MPLALSTPASRIVWSNREVTVETPAGRIAARAAIVTVSSNVLASGAIKFTPDIPKRQLDAAAKLSLGSYDHIALQLPGNPLGLGRDDVIIEQSNSTRTALLLANIGGSSLCSIDVAGSFGRDLSAQGEAGHGRLRDGMADQAVRQRGDGWREEVERDPLECVALRARRDVGGGARRPALAQDPDRADRRVFLAGEATHETLWGTVDGAWESGERAAEAALRRIGALKDAEPDAAPDAPRAPTPPFRRFDVFRGVNSCCVIRARSTPSSAGRPKMTAAAIRP